MIVRFTFFAVFCGASCSVFCLSSVPCPCQSSAFCFALDSLLQVLHVSPCLSEKESGPLVSSCHHMVCYCVYRSIGQGSRPVVCSACGAEQGAAFRYHVTCDCVPFIFHGRACPHHSVCWQWPSIPLVLWFSSNIARLCCRSSLSGESASIVLLASNGPPRTSWLSLVSSSCHDVTGPCTTICAHETLCEGCWGGHCLSVGALIILVASLIAAIAYCWLALVWDTYPMSYYQHMRWYVLL